MYKFLRVLFIACILTCAAGISSVIAEEVSVVSYEGTVDIIPKLGAKSIPCDVNMILKEGTRIKTGAGSSVEMAFDKDRYNIAKVSENSDIVLKLDGDEKIELVNGELYVLLEGLKGGGTFKVKTPSATCGARGTGWRTKATDKETDVSVFDNKVFVRGLNKDGTEQKNDFWVKKGFERRVEKFQKPDRMQKISDARMARMEKQIKRPDKPKQKTKEVKRKEKPADKKSDKVSQQNKLDEKRNKLTNRMEKTRERFERKEKIIDRSDNLRESLAVNIRERDTRTRLDALREEIKKDDSCRLPPPS